MHHNDGERVKRMSPKEREEFYQRMDSADFAQGLIDEIPTREPADSAPEGDAKEEEGQR